MRILIFNWKDIQNPIAGGAEVFTHEVARRLVTWGHDVTLFCARFPGSPPESQLDGVRIVRRGNRLSVYQEAKRFWRSEGRKAFDIVIDEVNTRPFLTPKYVRDAPILCLIHQLASDVWHQELPPVVSHIGRYILEPHWLGRYRQVPTVTVSASTKSDLELLGFEKVAIVPEGLSIEPLDGVPDKERFPTLLFVGRLVNTKRPDHAVRAHALLRRELPDTRLWMIGSGYMRKTLERMAAPGVKFLGATSNQEKYRLMARAHLLLVPGVREGWGLVVIEANAMGTPAIGYNIPGLRDSIRPGASGYLVEPRPEALAEAAHSLLRSNQRLRLLSRTALAHARAYSWNTTARVLLSYCDALVSSAGKHHSATTPSEWYGNP